MKKLDEWLIGAKCALRRLFFGKEPGIDGIIVVIVLVIIAVTILAVVGAKFQSISNDAMTKTESEIANRCFLHDVYVDNAFDSAGVKIPPENKESVATPLNVLLTPEQVDILGRYETSEELSFVKTRDVL